MKPTTGLRQLVQAQAFFTPQHTNSISSRLKAFSPNKMINNTAAPPSRACWRGHILQKLYSKCWGSAQGRARSLQTNTVTTSLQLSPTPTCGSSGGRVRLTNAVRGYPPGQGRRWSRAFSFVIKKNKCRKCSPSHTGDAKHPAGLQRDPDKLRQVGESSEATSAKMAFHNKSIRVVPLRFEVFNVEIYVTLHNVYAYAFFNKSNICTRKLLIHVLKYYCWCKQEAVLWSYMLTLLNGSHVWKQYKVGWAVKCETAPSCGEDKWLESTLNAAFKFRFNGGCGKRTHRII